MKNKSLLLALSGLLFLPVFAATDSPSGHQLAGNLLAYPYVETAPPAQTPAPEGYEPFHLEHYGRHGSRWLLGKEDYATPVENLEKAEKAGLLTPLGEKTLAALRDINEQSKGRLGELSDKGALQHRAIGRRMAQNYPEIFNENADIDARATIVIRCIISMANALEGIKEIAPAVTPRVIDASNADMYFMNYNDRPAWVFKDSADAVYLKKYREELSGNDSYLDRLVSDPAFARDSVGPGMLPRLYWVLANTQSHIGQPWLLEEVFSPEELEANWKLGNAGWFIHGGNTPMTEGRMPFVQRKLLNTIIDETDGAILSANPGAQLRYGHDGILVSIITLMELGGYGDEIATLEDLEKSDWKDYDIIPMAGNLQLVFYRPSGSTNPDEVLVKALINEREVSMPGNPVEGPYYSWKELKDYYTGKLSDFENKIN